MKSVVVRWMASYGDLHSVESMNNCVYKNDLCSCSYEGEAHHCVRYAQSKACTETIGMLSRSGLRQYIAGPFDGSGLNIQLKGSKGKIYTHFNVQSTKTFLPIFVIINNENKNNNENTDLKTKSVKLMFTKRNSNLTV